MSKRVHRYLSIASLAVVLFLSHTQMQADPLTVTASYASQGTNYLYDFAITNQASMDPYAKLIQVDFPSLPANSLVGEAVAPNNYGEVTDPSGYVLFDYNLGNFPAGPAIDGFQLIDSLQLNSISFEALYLSNDELSLNTFTGIVSPQGPLPAVPEPGTTGLLVCASAILLAGARVLRAMRQERQSVSS